MHIATIENIALQQNINLSNHIHNFWESKKLYVFISVYTIFQQIFCYFSHFGLSNSYGPGLSIYFAYQIKK